MSGEPRLAVHVLQAIPAQTMDATIEALTVAGAASIHPVLTESHRRRVRTRRRHRAERERWHAIAREAAQLAGRAAPPGGDAGDVAARRPRRSCRAGVRVARVRHRSRTRCRSSRAQSTSPADVALVIGPEGGLDERRPRRTRSSHGAAYVHLGPRTLPSRLAGAVATSLLLAGAGDLDIDRGATTAVSAAADRPLRVALTVLGCKVNFAEMADLAGRLAAGGCDVVPEGEHADVRVLNSCTVTTQADATTRQRLARLRRMDPDSHLVLTGCSVDANPGAYTHVDSVFANRRQGLDRSARAVHGTDSARPVPQLRLKPRRCGRERSSRCRTDATTGARTASSGVRAVTRSAFPRRIVLERVRAAVDAGHGEIVLCGVDLGSYGRDRGTDLATLLESVLDVVRRRTHPSQQRQRKRRDPCADPAQRPPAPVRALAHAAAERQRSRAARHASRLRRRQYLRVVGELRDVNPLTEFTTDIMVAFPGETDDDHARTLSLVDEVGFLAGHVFRWSPRPGTPASDLELASR